MTRYEIDAYISLVGAGDSEARDISNEIGSSLRQDIRRSLLAGEAGAHPRPRLEADEVPGGGARAAVKKLVNSKEQELQVLVDQAATRRGRTEKEVQAKVGGPPRSGLSRWCGETR